MTRRLGSVVLALLALGTAGAGVGVTHSAFTAGTQAPGNVVSSAADWAGPTTSRSVIQKAQGGDTGYVRTGGSFRVFAQVTDAGNPASGTASVQMQVPSTGYALALASGSFAADGLTYNWASGLTAVPFPSARSYPYNVRATDNLGQLGVTGTFPAVVDNTRPTATDVQRANGAGSVAGRPDPGDTLTLTFDEPIDGISVAAGWTTGAATVTARILNGTGSVDDRLVVDGSNFGTLNLGRNNYVTADTTFTGSTLTRSGNQIVLTLGTLAGGATGSGGGNGDMTFIPGTDMFDRAGNPLNPTSVTESGGNDRDF